MSNYTLITDGERFLGVIINRNIEFEGRWEEGELLENVKGGIHPALYSMNDLLRNENIARAYGFGLRLNTQNQVNAVLDFETSQLKLATDKDIPNVEMYPEFSYLKEGH